jgi:hypothetical protein
LAGRIPGLSRSEKVVARSSYLFTSESVSMGHPDKVADLPAAMKLAKLARLSAVTGRARVWMASLPGKANSSVPEGDS